MVVGVTLGVGDEGGDGGGDGGGEGGSKGRSRARWGKVAARLGGSQKGSGGGADLDDAGARGVELAAERVHLLGDLLLRHGVLDGRVRRLALPPRGRGGRQRTSARWRWSPTPIHTRSRGLPARDHRPPLPLSATVSLLVLAEAVAEYGCVC